MKSTNNNTNFWSNYINLISWHKKPKKIFSNRNSFFSWFVDGKINVTYNCINANILDGKENKTALFTIKKSGDIEKYTYKDLFFLINNFECFLKKKIQNKKQYVAIHASASIESAVAMLTCAKLGVPHAVFFEDLSKEAIKIRLELLKPQILITRSKNKNFIEKIKPLLLDKNFKNITFINFSENVTTYKKTKLIKINTKIFIKKLLKSKKKNFKKEHSLDNVKSFKSNNKLFALFTSGSTGVPKGIEHSSGGYLLFSKFTCKEKFGLTDNSVILTASDAGWINGHTYALYGPLSLGCTSVLIESPFCLLDIKILNKILLQCKVSHLYLPVTLIRLMKSINKNQKINSIYLKILGSMGEPLAPNVAKWFAKFFNLSGQPIINTYFQTETGGILFSPSFKDKKKKISYGSVGQGICNFLVDKIFQNKKFEIKIKNSWPGCMINVLNGKKYFRSYFDKNNYFKTFDLGYYDQKKNLNVIGRIDDVFNISGHRIGSAEIESTILKIPGITEAAAIAGEDSLKGNKIFIFVSTKFNKNNFENKIRQVIKETFGPYNDIWSVALTMLEFLTGTNIISKL